MSKARTYEVTCPDGTKVRKTKFGVDAETLPATAMMHNGKWSVVVFAHSEVRTYPGDTLLTARRVK